MSAGVLAAKLNGNFGPAALQVLGSSGYLRYLKRVATHLPGVIRAGDLRPVDEMMGDRVLKLRVAETNVFIDCPFADQTIRDGSFTFGAIRELYIRNCYLRAPAWRSGSRPRVVVDLGANRGLFSTLMAGIAERVIAVEAQSEFAPVIERNMKVNDRTNFALQLAFVGHADGGEHSGMALHRPGSNVARVSVSDVIQEHRIDTIDLLKIDIEGAEFDLFSEASWLQRVNAITMEIHPQCGSVLSVLDKLRMEGFAVRYATHSYSVPSDPQRASLVWASRT